MRICQVMLARGFGGAERYFVDLCRELAVRGHDILAVCHPAGTAAGLLANVAGITVRGLATAGSWDPLAPWRLRGFIRRWSPTLVHAHLARAAYLAGKAQPDGVPLVAKTHNYVDLKYYRRVHCFIATTDDQREHLLRSGIATAAVVVIPNFSALSPVLAPAPASTRVILACAGRLVRKKGFDVLLRAMAHLQQQGMTVPVLLFGDGPMRQELEALAQALGVAGQVQMPGWQQDMAAALDRCSVFVLPSLDEPFGIVLLEAMARGKPIITTATAGPGSILSGAEACFVRPGDSAALAEAIRALAENPAHADALAAAALRRFNDEFSAAVVVPRIEALYRRLTGSTQ